MFADAGGGDEVERAGPEPVGGPGERTDRADLHGVTAEVGVERLAGGDADLLQGAAFEQFDERVAGDLVGEPGAAGAQHAAFAVEQHLGREVDRFREGALDVGEAGLGATVGHGLVLQRAFPALVADRAVQWVIDQQQFHHTLLGVVCRLRGVLGAHHHAVGDGDGAAGHRLALALDLHQALAAGAHGLEQGMVAEPGNLHADQLGGANHQGALGNRQRGVVDGDGHQLGAGAGLGCLCHAPTPLSASRRKLARLGRHACDFVSARGGRGTGSVMRRPPWGRRAWRRTGRTGRVRRGVPRTRRGSTAARR